MTPGETDPHSTGHPGRVESDLALSAPRALERGEQVGRYVVLRKLGSGGMGVVYLAYDPELDRKIAIKLLRPRTNKKRRRQRHRQRLIREAQSLARLRHPNVISVHDVGEHDGQVFMAMDYVEGTDLHGWLHLKPRSWQEVVEVFEHAGRGLAAAHEKGVIHRDFKPENVLIGNDGQVVVMDFGLARSLSPGPRLTAVGDSPSAHARERADSPSWTDDGEPELPTESTEGELLVRADEVPEIRRLESRPPPPELTVVGAQVGTPAYMSPEQFQGAAADERSDQFSFCVSLWEGLYGQRPFEGEEVYALTTAVLNGEIAAPPVDRAVPRWLRQLCERGLESDPTDRHASMLALLEQLGHRHRRVWLRRALLAVGAVTVLAAAAWGYGQYDRAQQIAACEAQGATIDEIWNGTRRSDLEVSMLASGAGIAKDTFARVTPRFDALASDWASSRTEACMHARVDLTWDEVEFERASWCLEDQRMGIDALLSVLAEGGPTAVRQAVTAAARLPEPRRCLDAQRLARIDPPPADARESTAGVQEMLARVRALDAAGEHRRGLEVVRRARTDAQRLDWPPVLADATFLEGRLLALNGDYDAAEARLVEAYTMASKAMRWDVAARAATFLIYHHGGVHARYEEAKRWSLLAEIAVSLEDDESGLLDASRRFALAGAHKRAGHFQTALPEYERALDLQTAALGEDHVDTTSTLSALGGVHFKLGNYHLAEQLLTRNVEFQRAVLGSRHPSLATHLNTLGNVVNMQGDEAAALAYYREAHAILRAGSGARHPMLAIYEGNIGKTLHEQGELDEAQAHLERALALTRDTLGDEHPRVAGFLHGLALIQQDRGELETARESMERALELGARPMGPDNPTLSFQHNGLAGVLNDLRAYPEALAHAERALELARASLGEDHFSIANALFNRGVARAHTGDPKGARSDFERAIDIYERNLGPEDRDIALVLVALAELDLDDGAPRDALARVERAQRILRVSDASPLRRAEADFAMARVLWDLPAEAGRNRGRAVALARVARSKLQREAPSASALAEMERWLARHS